MRFANNSPGLQRFSSPQEFPLRSPHAPDPEGGPGLDNAFKTRSCCGELVDIPLQYAERTELFAEGT
jgi:hypothetical protein